MICTHCSGSRKYKKPNDQDMFDKIIDSEMEKGDFISYSMAEERAYKKVGYTLIDCPYCNKLGKNI